MPKNGVPGRKKAVKGAPVWQGPAMKSPLEVVLNVFIERMLHENAKGRVLGFGFTMQPDDPENRTIWWMLGRCQEGGKISEDMVITAGMNGFNTNQVLSSEDGSIDAYRLVDPLRKTTAEDVVARIESPAGPAATPAAPALASAPRGRSEWQDDDELTRAEAAARLGTTDRYFRTQFEAGKVRGRRYSRKTIKYVWGEIREDWKKLTSGE